MSRYWCVIGIVIGIAGGARSARAQDVLGTTVCAVQGAGASTPFSGRLVEVEGIVTADFVDTDLRGFFIQAPDCDADPATSDGLWIYDRDGMASVATGQAVRITGRAGEHFGLTEIVLERATVLTTSLTIVPAVPIDPPADPAEAATFFEGFEGMLVDPGPVRVVGATNAHGDAYVVPADSGIGRIFRDGESGKRMGLIFAAEWRAVDFGATLYDVVGPLTFNFGEFKVAVPTEVDRGVTVVSDPFLVPPRMPHSRPDELTVASYNLENLFDTIDDPGKDDTEWTVSPERYAVDIARRARSIAENLGLPDIVAVQEVETLAVLEDLASHPYVAAADYGARLIEGRDGRGIDVGFLFDQDKVRVLGVEQREPCTALSVPEPGIACTQPNGQPGYLLFSRPPLVARFEVIATGARLTIVNNHFKSKSGGDEKTAPIRIAQAEAVRLIAVSSMDSELDATVMVVGDLNDFPATAPLQRLVGDGRLVDLHQDPRMVPPDHDYTYVFNGVSQVLDYILVEPDLLVDPERVIAAFAPVHTNTDFGAPAPGDDNPAVQRVSDHDPVLARLNLDALPVTTPNARIYMPRAVKGHGADRLHTASPTTMATSPTPTPADPPTPLPTTPPTTPPTASPTTPPAAVPTSPPTTPPIMPPTSAPSTAAPTAASGAPPRTPLRIDHLNYDGEEPRFEGDEYVEFTNVTSDVVSLTGWQVVSVKGTRKYMFPTGARIEPGQTCRVYTDEDHPEHCGFNWEHSNAIWANTGDKAELRDPTGDVIDWFCYGDHDGECGG